MLQRFQASCIRCVSSRRIGWESPVLVCSNFNVDKRRFLSKGNEAVRVIQSTNAELVEHIQSSKQLDNPRDTGFSISFLGTSGGSPSYQRMTSATQLRFGGMIYLFDAGEGIQRQLISTRATLLDIVKIFITHLHADHILGLPGLLLGLQQARGLRDVEVDIYGPPGIYNYVASTLRFCRAYFAFAKVTIYELVGGEADSGRHHDENKPTNFESTQGRWKRSILHSHYPEIANRCLIRRKIERNANGVWVIQSPSKLTEEDFREAANKGGRVSSENAGEQTEVRIQAAEVEHQEGIQTFGFVIQEQEHPRTINAEKAEALGVKPSPKYRILKHGFSVMSDDGTREVRPEEVLAEQTRVARKFALIGDNSELSDAMRNLCQDADVLVHEATMSSDMKAEALLRKHATAEMAGLVAKQVNAKALVLTHFSPKFNEPEQIEQLVREAEAANDGVSQILAAQDFMELLVPWEGFRK